MKVEYKSMFIGIFAGIVGVYIILFVLGNVETEFSFTMGDPIKKKNKNINVSINRTIDNGEDLTNVIIKGSGNVTREELDTELERLLKEHGIDKNNSNFLVHALMLFGNNFLLFRTFRHFNLFAISNFSPFRTFGRQDGRNLILRTPL